MNISLSPGVKSDHTSAGNEDRRFSLLSHRDHAYRYTRDPDRKQDEPTRLDRLMTRLPLTRRLDLATLPRNLFITPMTYTSQTGYGVPASLPDTHSPGPPPETRCACAETNSLGKPFAPYATSRIRYSQPPAGGMDTKSGFMAWTGPRTSVPIGN